MTVKGEEKKVIIAGSILGVTVFISEELELVML